MSANGIKPTLSDFHKAEIAFIGGVRQQVFSQFLRMSALAKDRPSASVSMQADSLDSWPGHIDGRKSG